jgi:prevent-host-death family protein
MQATPDMQQVNIHEAKTHLSALLENKTRQGESFIIAKAGKAAAVVVPFETYKAQSALPRTGFLKGRYEVPDDFDTMMQDEIIALFEDGGL